MALLVAGGAIVHFGNNKGGTAVTRHVTAAAIDGDTLRVGRHRYRLVGIDAPELDQTCRDENGRPWACGGEALARLSGLVGFGGVECKSSSRDRYGRPLAVCSSGSVPDIGEAMVRAGYAVSYMSWTYWLAERDARAHKRGIWRGTFTSPQAWRSGARDAG